MTSQGAVGGLAWRTGPFLLLIAAILLCLAVLVVNHGPLYYFDTGSYFKQGNATLSLILPEDTQSAGAVGANQIAQTDDTTNGSRSMIYALLVAVFWRLDALGGIALVNLAAVLLSVWLVVRAARRTGLLQRSGMSLIAIPLLAAAVTALPFYIAYVMPDIFAPVLLILIAAVVAMGREMTLNRTPDGASLGGPGSGSASVASGNCGTDAALGRSGSPPAARIGPLVRRWFRCLPRSDRIRRA